MSRKDKRKPGSAGGKGLAPHAMESAALAQAAVQALNSRHFREAVEFYKELLKREPCSEWQERLADAYVGRAGELAGKGLLKEAMTVWRNRAEVCGKPLMAGPYSGWLLQTGEMAEVMRHYRQRLASPDRTGLAELEAQLAPHVLAAPDALLSTLPADSPLLRYRPAARAALEAYCRGDADLEDHLKGIPFRSPFRDLGQVLKALLLLADDPDAAQAAWQRISSESPFGSLAQVLRTALLPAGSAWLRAVFSLNSAQRAVALDLKGVPQTAEPLLAELAQLGQEPSAVALFNVLLRHRKSLQEATAKSLCRQLLLHVQDDGLRGYVQAFGRLAPFEVQRLQALRGELQGRLVDAEDFWLAGVKCLVSDDHAGALRVASIWRHAAELSTKRASLSGVPSDDAVVWLAESLRHDPQDLPTYLQLLPAYRARGDLKSARALLDDALDRFPGHAEILLEAIEAALAGNAFKKAVGYARRVLELDPINTKVRSLLGGAHLAHARKQIKAGKFDAAGKELDDAAEWLRTPRERGELLVLKGILAQAAGKPEEGRQYLKNALSELGAETLVYFLLSLEMARVNRGPAELAKVLDFPVPKQIAAADLMALVKAIDESKSAAGLLRKALAPLHKLLRGAVALNLPERDSLALCETLLRLDQIDLLRAFAEAARKRHPRHPLFIYHAVNARHGKAPWNIPSREVSELERARQRAAEHGDHRAVLRIDRLLEPPPGFFIDPDEEDHELPFGELGVPSPMRSGEIAELMRALEEMGPEAFIGELGKALGKDTLREMEREVGRKNLLPLLLEMLGVSAAGLPKPHPLKPKVRDKPAPKSSRQRDLFDD